MKDLFLFSNFICSMLIILQIIVNYSFSQPKSLHDIKFQFPYFFRFMGRHVRISSTGIRTPRPRRWSFTWVIRIPLALIPYFLEPFAVSPLPFLLSRLSVPALHSNVRINHLFLCRGHPKVCMNRIILCSTHSIFCISYFFFYSNGSKVSSSQLFLCSTHPKVCMNHIFLCSIHSKFCSGHFFLCSGPLNVCAGRRIFRLRRTGFRR